MNSTHFRVTCQISNKETSGQWLIKINVWFDYKCSLSDV